MTKKEFYCVQKSTWEGFYIDSYWRSKKLANERCRKKLQDQFDDEGEVEEVDKWCVQPCKLED